MSDIVRWAYLTSLRKKDWWFDWAGIPSNIQKSEAKIQNAFNAEYFFYWNMLGLNSMDTNAFIEKYCI